MKRDDETWDEFLQRLTSSEEPIDEQLALEASRLQDASIKDGSELTHRDAMIAATARSTGDEYVVADSDFETEPLEAVMDVTNLHGD